MRKSKELKRAKRRSRRALILKYITLKVLHKINSGKQGPAGRTSQAIRVYLSISTVQASPSAAAGAKGARMMRAPGIGEHPQHGGVLDRERRRRHHVALGWIDGPHIVLPEVVGRHRRAQASRREHPVRPAGRQAAPAAVSGTVASRRGLPPDCRAGRGSACSPRRPNISGLPGRIAIFQKSSVTPCVGQHLMDEVVVAHRGAAERHDDIRAGLAALFKPCGDRLLAVAARCRGRAHARPPPWRWRPRHRHWMR